MAITASMNPIILRPRRHSPFERIIAFDYNDGPTSGVVRDDDRPTSYLFDVQAVDVDGHYDFESWNRGEEIRIFSLSPLPVGVFERLVEAVSAIEAPKWPVWVPGAPSRTRQMQTVIDRELAPILASSSPTQVVAASNLLGTILAVEDFPTPAPSPGFDWFAYLGLTISS